MRKILISLFLAIGILTFTEENEVKEVTRQFSATGENISTETIVSENTEKILGNESTVGVYEYRPATLRELDRQIAIPANRGNLRNLYAKYDTELRVYLESINYNSESIFFLANEYVLLNNYERANKIFLLDNKDLKNVFGAATTFRFMGKNEEAIAKYNEAISMNSSFPENYLGRALANRNMDNYDSAINDLKRYISMTSGVEGYAALADIYFKLGKTKEAYSTASTGLGKYPDSDLLKTLVRNISRNGVN